MFYTNFCLNNNTTIFFGHHDNKEKDENKKKRTTTEHFKPKFRRDVKWKRMSELFFMITIKTFVQQKENNEK